MFFEAIVRVTLTFLQGSAKEEEDRAFASKQSRLQLAQVLGLDQPEEKDPKKPDVQANASKGWGEQIAMKIVDNMQIFIDKVRWHIHSY